MLSRYFLFYIRFDCGNGPFVNSRRAKNLKIIFEHDIDVAITNGHRESDFIISFGTKRESILK